MVDTRQNILSFFLRGSYVLATLTASSQVFCRSHFGQSRMITLLFSRHKSVAHIAQRRRASRVVASMGQHVDALPSTFRQLVGKRTGPDFRSVAEIEECALEHPGEGQVWFGCLQVSKDMAAMVYKCACDEIYALFTGASARRFCRRQWWVCWPCRTLHDAHVTPS
jgi:hypothetical protein